MPTVARGSRAAIAKALLDIDARATDLWRVGTGAAAASVVEPEPQALPPLPTLRGTTGNDVLTGTALTDLIEDEWGNDTIDGGGGDDVITDKGGSNILRGGGGNDYILLFNQSRATVHGEIVFTNLVEAGDGDDSVRINLAVHQRLTVDLGAGNDLLTFGAPYVLDNQVSIATGTGADRIVFDFDHGDALRLNESGPVVIADFTAGNGGDILDLAGMLKGLLAYTPYSGNPFAGGYLRLIQDGADVLVRVDLDGNGPATGGWYIRDVVRLTGVTVGALTAYNLAGFAQNGAAPGHTIYNGTPAGEWLNADAGGSDLFGLGGADRLTGGVGADLIEGGTGNDVIEGGLGSDILRGGDGDDILHDISGNDLIEGGAGNDRIAIVRPSPASGLPVINEQVTINAGDGDDFVSFRTEQLPFEYENLRRVALTVDLGAGNDRIELFHILVPGAQLTLGAGQDRVVFDRFYLDDNGYGEEPSLTPLVITDFAAGNSGDILDLDSLMDTNQSAVAAGNPFAAGHLRLQQVGADTRVVYDYYGTGNPIYFHTVVMLANVNAASLTAFNFNGYAPSGSPSSYTVIGGTAGDDRLVGSYAADVINGGDGDDLIEELKRGDDILSGGGGNDLILVNHVNWQQLAEVVTIDAGTGDDTVEFAGNWGRLNADLGTGNDRIRLFAAPEAGAFLTLGAGADVVVIDAEMSSQVGGAITITDFATGAGGDRLDWTMFAEIELSTYHSAYNPYFMDMAVYNPFLGEDARLVQSGADTLLQLNTYANRNFTPAYVTLVTFKNVSLAGFTADNLGYALYRPTQSGGAGNDILSGTAGADIVAGEAGNDQLDGAGGDDLLRGHDGDDLLTGGAGRDRLYGGAGADTLTGGDDDDWLSGDSGKDAVNGGTGNDVILDTYGQDDIVAGAGNDIVNVNFDLGTGNQGWTPGSIDAGDGNDVVTLLGPLGDYPVDLGAGDDLIRFDRVFSGLVLGAGRDTVIFSPPSNMGGTGFFFSDFTPGDAGDIFDLTAYVNGRMLFHDGLTVLPGRNPFALGYAVLRQAGSDVELILYRDGLPDEELYGSPTPIVFRNTSLAQFTAANFGGFDPHVTANYATLVSGDLTIAAGQTLETVNVTPYLDLSAAYVVRTVGGGDIDLVNHGTITHRMTEARLGYLNGVYVVQGWVPGGSFVNAADGRFVIKSEWVDQSGDVGSGRTYGFYAPSQSLLFRNDGYFEIRAASGTVTGVTAGFDIFNYYPVINNGTFLAVSADEAYGFALGGTSQFINSGSITVSGRNFALGVWFRNYTDGQFENHGTITATTSLTGTYYSIGVLAWHGLGVDSTYRNSGTITADIAFYSDDGNTNHVANRDVLYNSGRINGEIYLGDSVDRLINTGVIDGMVSLGLSNDIYDGRGGTLLGYVLGDDGEDTLYGGGGIDDLEGGAGADLLIGGGGGDFLTGSAGADRFAYFAVSDSAFNAEDYILDFQTGIDKIDLSGLSPSGASWTQQVDGFGNPFYMLKVACAGGLVYIRVYGQLSLNDLIMDGVRWGTPLDDALYGTSGPDELNGLQGNDILDGRGGADVMRGGAGDDIMFVDNAGDVVVESVTEGFDRVLTTVDYTLGEGVYAERLETADAAGTAPLALGGNALENVIYGNAGSNILYGKGGFDTLFGGAGDDFYYVSDAGDFIVELAGGGFDRILTSVDYSLNDEGLVEVISTDSNTGTAALALGGNNHENIIIGNDGNNILYGKGGFDTIYGRAGNDTYYVSDAGDLIVELQNEGNDRIYASVDYTLFDDGYVETLSTEFIAGTANLSLGGNNLANTLIGNNGNNTLYGKGGADTLYGHGGADTFLFVTKGAGDVDAIGDFVSGTDKIAFYQSVYTGLSSGTLSANAFVIGSAAADGDDRIIYNQATGALFYDADGTGAQAAIQFATVTPGQTLVASDFVVF